MRNFGQNKLITAYRAKSNLKEKIDNSDIKFPFFDYSLTLSSFLSLDKTPFIGAMSTEGDLKENPLTIISVFGDSGVGKTRLMAELEKKFSLVKRAYRKEESNPNAIYFKSVVNHSSSKISVLFMKAPSLSQKMLSQRDNELPYGQLLLERKLMKKFVVGFLSIYSHILIFVVGLENGEGYRKYFEEIKRRKGPDDRIFIVHNLSLPPKEKEPAEINNLKNIPIPKDVTSRIRGKTIPSSSKPVIIQASLNNSIHAQDDKMKADSLMKELENEDKYTKSNFIHLNSNENYDLEYFYSEKNDPTVIHLLYNPLSSNEESEGLSSQKKNNFQMKKFLSQCISGYLAKKEKQQSIFSSFKEYLSFYAGQIYQTQPEVIEDKGRYKLAQPCKLKAISEDLIEMNYPQKENAFSFAYEIVNNELLLHIEKVAKCTFTVNAKIIGDMNVIAGKCSFGKKENTVYSNLPEEEQLFAIKIPTNTCVIKNFKANIINNNDGTITLKYEILTSSLEKGVSI